MRIAFRFVAQYVLGSYTMAPTPDIRPFTADFTSDESWRDIPKPEDSWYDEDAWLRRLEQDADALKSDNQRMTDNMQQDWQLNDCTPVRRARAQDGERGRGGGESAHACV